MRVLEFISGLMESNITGSFWVAKLMVWVLGFTAMEFISEIGKTEKTKTQERFTGQTEQNLKEIS